MGADREGPGLLSIVLRLLGCLAASFVAWRLLGPVGIVITSPLYGIAFARPILEAMSGLYRALHGAVHRDRQGQHFAYRGQMLTIDEDDEGVRWLRVADVRKLLPHFPREDALAVMFAERLRCDDERGEQWIQAGALDSYLAQARSDDSIRFKVWLQRQVIRPSPAGRASAPLRPMSAPPPTPSPSPPPTRSNP